MYEDILSIDLKDESNEQMQILKPKKKLVKPKNFLEPKKLPKTESTHHSNRTKKSYFYESSFSSYFWRLVFGPGLAPFLDPPLHTTMLHSDGFAKMIYSITLVISLSKHLIRYVCHLLLLVLLVLELDWTSHLSTPTIFCVVLMLRPRLGTRFIFQLRILPSFPGVFRRNLHEPR